MLKRILAAVILISACNPGPARAQDAAAPFDGDLQRLAEQATGWVKPLVALAGGIINAGGEADVDYIMTH